MPDPLMGLRPSELCSSRAAVRRLQRRSPHVVRRSRPACLTDEKTPSSKLQRRNAGTRRSTPGALRRQPVPRHRIPTCSARWKSRTRSPGAEARESLRRHPDVGFRVAVPKHRDSFTSTRRALDSKACRRGGLPSLSSARSSAPSRSSPPKRPTLDRAPPAPKSSSRTAETTGTRNPAELTSPAPKRQPPSPVPNTDSSLPYSTEDPLNSQRRDAGCHRTRAAETPLARRPATPRCRASTEPAAPKRREPAVREPKLTGSDKPAGASPPSGVCSARESATPRQRVRPTEARGSLGLSTLQGFLPHDSGPAFTAPPLMGFLSSDANGR
jgi:hypothetical protein